MNNSDTLRDRYLHILLQIAENKPMARFEMYGGATVDGQLCATDTETNRFRVNQLQSPMGIYDKAIIRGSDLNILSYSK